MGSPNVRQSYYPPMDASIPAPVAVHLRLLYTGLNQHDQLLNEQAQGTTATTSTKSSSGGGATGQITLAALSTSGSQGSLTINNGLITSFTNPT